jgi:hypothetical protein
MSCKILRNGQTAKMPKWAPIPGVLATYIGRTKASKRNVLVVAEAVAGRMCVQAIGKKGVIVRFTVKRESLQEPQPDLFG